MIGKFIDKIRAKRTQKNIPTVGQLKPGSGPPQILTPWGPTTESARLQAAINMRADPVLKAKVEELLIRQLGSFEAGVEESRRRYPESYQDDEK